MKKIRITILYSLVLLLTGSCIHQYPAGVESVETKKVNLNVEVTFDREFIPLPVITKSEPDVVPEGYLPRFIVEACKPGENVPCARQVVSVNAGQLLGDRILLPVSLPLDAEPHNLTVWADCVKDESLADAHYNTESLRSVSYLTPYMEDHLARDAFFGNLAVDLSHSEGEVTARVSMKRPLAHYRVIATDVQEFLGKQQANGRPGTGEYEVTVTYQYFLVTRMNATTGELTNSGTGFGYTRKINITNDMTECELGADYVLADDKGSLVTVTVEVKDREGDTVSRSVNLEIPYKRGHTTTVTGAFLTSKSGSGSSEGGLNVGIDDDYDGEFNVNMSGE